MNEAMKSNSFIVVVEVPKDMDMALKLYLDTNQPQQVWENCIFL